MINCVHVYDSERLLALFELLLVMIPREGLRGHYHEPVLHPSVRLIALLGHLPPLHDRLGISHQCVCNLLDNQALLRLQRYLLLRI